VKQPTFFDDVPPAAKPMAAVRSYREDLREQIIRDHQTLRLAHCVPNREFFEARIAMYLAEIETLI
jgi:hypothetical protein